jgi:4-hydroxybenzoate polyprenyltransferase
MIFGSTLLVYNLPRVVLKAGIKNSWRPARPWGYFFCVAGSAVAAAGIYNIPVQARVYSSVLSVFAFSYFLPVLPFKNVKRLRDIGWLKISVLTAVWTMATSMLPIIYLRQSILSFPLEIFMRMAFIFSLCMLFDLRDLQKDAQNNITTLALKLGLRNSYHLIYFALLVFVFLGFVQYLRYPVPGRLAGTLFTATILADGVMLVYACSVLIMSF